MNYWRGVLIAIDQLANALFNGWPDETLSSRAWRWHIQGKRSWPRQMIDCLFALFGDLNHCENANRSEAMDNHLPRSLRHPP